MEALALGALRHAAGTVRLPGSKSISNRTLLLAALAEGRTRVADLLDSDDTRVMLGALAALGVPVARDGADHLIDGVGGRFPVRDADLFMGNAGTAIRPLTAALALSGGSYRLSGVPRMHERPIGDLVDGLAALGADIRYTGAPGYPPLEIRPAPVALAGPVPVRGNVSSQFLTALLMALPLLARAADRPATIEVVGELISKPYVEITLNLMRRFGVDVERSGWQAFRIPAGARYASPGTVHVEGDASSASYFLAAGALGGGPLRVEGVGRDSIQGDIRFADALAQMGANLMAGPNWIEVRGFTNEDHPARLRAFDADFNHIPDAAMTLAVLALFADGPCTLRNIGSWRVKETDRIAAMATELGKLGAAVEAGADWLRVTPPARLVPAAIDTYDDHRMAMSFALAAFGLAPGDAPLVINDPGCVAKTYPDFFADFGRVTRA
ncbi:MAG: 3-phosphoshikimate 1-carboxyvinyltransferase [Burkholderiales bacterium]|nr:3-phosphoshikimate 1-carboxyvinyltransferase [Burkholderiales bacterium]